MIVGLVEDRREHRHERDPGDEHDAGERELERHRLAKRELLVGLVLLDVLLADPDLAQEHEREQDDEDDAPDAVLRGRQERGDEEAAHEVERVDAEEERGVDDRAARRADAQARAGLWATAGGIDEGSAPGRCRSAATAHDTAHGSAGSRSAAVVARASLASRAVMPLDDFLIGAALFGAMLAAVAAARR